MILESKTGTKFAGFYKGQVLSHLPNACCKIWIPGVYPEEWCTIDSQKTDVYNRPMRGAKLPDAAPALSPVGWKNDQGIYAMPAILSWVWCFFENEDSNKPVYFASIPGERTLRVMEDMTKQTITHNQSKDPNLIERDVMLKFGRAFIHFSPDEKIEIGFKSLDKPNLEGASPSIEPRLTIDKAGRITLEASDIQLVTSGSPGILLSHAAPSAKNELRLNNNGIQMTSYAENGKIMLDATNSLVLYSDTAIFLQDRLEKQGPKIRKNGVNTLPPKEHALWGVNVGTLA